VPAGLHPDPGGPGQDQFNQADSLTISRGFISRLLFGGSGSSLALNEDGLIASGGATSIEVRIQTMIRPVALLDAGRFWGTLVIHTKDGVSRFKGYPVVPLRQFVTALNGLLAARARERIEAESVHTRHAASLINDLLGLRRYARSSHVTRVLEVARKTPPLPMGLLWDLYATSAEKGAAATVAGFVASSAQLVAEANRRYVAQQLGRFSDLFDSVETSPLTLAQREACVKNEDSNLVLAGAGTGKTSTMMGRAGYLLASGEAKCDEILMLAFARKAADEMQARQDSCLQPYAPAGTPTVKTFHALGLDIIGRAEGARPAISVLAEDTFALNRFINDQLTLQCLSPEYVASVISWCFNGRFLYGNPFDFASEDAYFEYVRTNELRTMQGELVKSYEELVIANFLYANGVKYEYEKKYLIPASSRVPGDRYGYIQDAEHRPYMPDFYLSDYDAYLEHFALNGEMRAPSGWQGYEDGVEWKRSLHVQYGTRLLETRSHMQFDGVLELCLDAMLRNAGVVLVPRPVEDLLDELREMGSLKYVTDPIASFLGLLKQSDLSLDGARTLGSMRDDAARVDLFFTLFEPIYAAYESILSTNREIDFSDMIRRAIGHVESGRYSSPFRHILVDEFQDISALRARLVRALVRQIPDSVLFAVGDDWQAIYRFTGSDIGLTRGFESAFGPTATTALDLTFRFNDKIGEVTSEFILQNPDQIKKGIRSLRRSDEFAVSLLPTSDPDTGIRHALNSFEQRREREGIRRASVLVLGRYHYVTEQWREEGARHRLREDFSNLDIEFATAHASKGREADFVVILGLEMGRNGFPAEKPTDPLMDLLLPELEAFPFAEERRLFYVGMTRARHRVVLVYEPTLASTFIHELASRRSDGTPKHQICFDEFAHAEGVGAHSAPMTCPRCERGYLSVRKGEYGDFVGCNRFPYCRYTEPPCPLCGSVMQREADFRVCTQDGCDETSPICPKCGGAMVRRTSQYGPFWGCINYKPNPGYTCTHTINIGSPYRNSQKYGYVTIDSHSTPPTRPSSAARTGKFEVGDIVDHKTFGRGIVQAVKGDALAIRFERTGETKKLLAGYAPLVKVVV